MKLLALFATFVAVTQAAEPGDLDWWKHAVFYQIYPRSIKDSNNDGIGEIPGVIQKLDHFSESGINAVWLSSIFKSPQVDQGYDISNYTDIEPDYGTIQDLEEFIEKAHSEGIKIIFDFVPNHTSDQHQWFIDSVNGVEEYRDYYIWANAKVDDNGERQPPNNWWYNRLEEPDPKTTRKFDSKLVPNDLSQVM